ncbi:CARDB domain-containing protein [Pyrococcus kukulkanii]|uniref:CARDB domain-containing protein n=1 Tax=Pyrococcus kukulkanii TaxID=1609559 RepID=A0A127B912_9EURY|nr:CARDB domain-containing protein [Pyrococcus kukulkanii]AMM53784.1 hypothetical protein TQ32_04255 [Pyrococcus kukulkanii]
MGSLHPKFAILIVSVILVLSAFPASAMYGTKIIDGQLFDWTSSDVVAIGLDSGKDGANLDKLYVAWDENYLYIALKTNNTASWNVAYGIGIDIDPGKGTGYTGDTDAWGRQIKFGNGFGIEYEIYFWWSWDSGMGTDHFIVWNESSWTGYSSLSSIGGSYSYIGDTSTGLQFIEIKIPWSALGGKPEKIGIIAWITGESGSAVDSLPFDPAVKDSENEWTDQDTFTNLAVISVGSKTIDGDLSDWSENEAILSPPSGLEGADIEKMYVSWDDEYLYIALKTNNTASWNVAYGIGIDVDPGEGTGYTGDTDAWGRKIKFANGFGLEFEIYFWWGWDSGMGPHNFIKWTGNGWEYKSINDIGGSYAYTGDTNTGLQTLEIKIPWSALGGKKSKFAIIAWVAGEEGSSAVDTAPADPAVGDSENEWTDDDTFTSLYLEEWFLMPDLTVSISGPQAIGINRIAEYTVYVKNEGSLDVSDVNVKVYINGTEYKNWTIDVKAGSEVKLTFNWTPTQEGMYKIKVIVDEENKIHEANENNNEYTLVVNVVWVGKIEIDGNPDDWLSVELTNNSYKVTGGFFIWKDMVGDQRHDKDPYLPGKTSSHADLVEFEVTKDDRYLYFLLKFDNMSNIKIGDNGATFVAIPIDYKEGGSYWFAGEMDTKTVIPWDVQVVVNLASSDFKGETKVVTSVSTSKDGLFYIVDSEGNIIQCQDALVGVDLAKNAIEIRIPLSLIGGSDEMNLQLATAFSYGPAVWNFGDPFANDEISDVVDTISEESTEDELADNVPDYYVKLKLNTGVEWASVINYKIERLEIKRREAIQKFLEINKYYGIARYRIEYEKYNELIRNISSMEIPPELREKIENLTAEVPELEKAFQEGIYDIKAGRYSIISAVKIYRAYTGLIRINEALERIIQLIVSRQLEWEKEMEELKGKLTKTIDGNLSDWNVKPIVEDNENFGQDGADLKALYVDHDDNFLYIALTTRNKASWRIAYGIALDYEDGGYTTGGDAWGRNIDFERGIDAQIYLFWNGEFFGNPGTNNITSANLAIWKNGTWEYLKLDKYAFYAYTGEDNGLQTLEIAIPWKVLGEKPERLYIVAYITGQGVGDSAVDALPDQPAIHDSDNEWTDFDVFTNFAEVVLK